MDQDNAPKELNVQGFAEDVYNAVMDGSGDGIDAFYSCLESAPGVDTQLLAVVQQGTQRLYEALADRLEAGIELFEQNCRSAIFLAPPSATPTTLPALPELPSGSDRADSSGEQEVADRVNDLRQRLAAADQGCSMLRDQLAAVDGQLASCADQPELAALAGTALSSKQTIQAIATAAEALQEMLERAQRLRAQAFARPGTADHAVMNFPNNTPGTVPLEAVQAFQRAIFA